jgi:DNA-binding transcriptional LysR family regulator
VAAPAYLAERGIPKTPSDLSNHDSIGGPGLSGKSGWAFKRAGAVTFATIEPSIHVGTADAVVACAKAGLGIGLASWWMCKAELKSGELVPVLSDYQLDAVELHAVYPGGRKPSFKVKALSDFLASKLKMSVPGAGRK